MPFHYELARRKDGCCEALKIDAISQNGILHIFGDDLCYAYHCNNVIFTYYQSTWPRMLPNDGCFSVCSFTVRVGTVNSSTQYYWLCHGFGRCVKFIQFNRSL